MKSKKLAQMGEILKGYTYAVEVPHDQYPGLAALQRMAQEHNPQEWLPWSK